MESLIENDQLSHREDDHPINIGSANNKARFTKYLLTCLLIAVAGSGFQYGWSIAMFNTPSDVIKEFYQEVYNKTHEKPMDDTTLNSYWSITNGLVPFGGIFGGFSSGFVADSFGRFYTIMVSRFLAGIYSGLFSGILPLYLSECSSKNLRGLTGTMNQLSIVTGVLAANIIGLPSLLGTKELWPVLVASTIVPVIIHLALFLTDESPKYLFINKNDKLGAQKVLTKFLDKDMGLVNEEMAQLEEEKERQNAASQSSWGDLYSKRPYFRALIVTIGLQLTQQFSGINAVIFYSTDIFKKAGLKDEWPIYATILLGIVQLIMTLVCMLLIDKAGRKILLLLGAIGMSFFSFLIAICRIFGEKDSHEWLNYMTVISAMLYIVFFSIGPGAIPWLITAELFSSDVRGKATSIAVFVNWFSNLIITISFPFIEKEIGSYSFLIFGVLLIFFAIFIFFFVPETKNRSIEQTISILDENLIHSCKRD